MEIRNLLAEHGDAIVIKTMSDNQPYTIVIDGGPGRTDEKMASYYKRLGQIDLMVLTHFDEDHIAGIKAYFRLYKNEELPVTRFWGNCAKGIDVADNTNISDAGNRNAGTLAYYLRKQKETNESFEWREDIASPLIYAFGDLKITILSPSPEILSTLKSEYENYLKLHPIIIDDETEDDSKIASKRVIKDAHTSIDILSQTDTPRSVNLMNKASIAFFLEAEGKRILMLGDSDPDIVADAIETLDMPKPMHVDMVKVSHHGSKNNISKRLLSLIQCDNYMFSTNGGTANSYHPDRKTLALILRNDNRSASPVNFYFNYPIADIQKRTKMLLSGAELQQENCNIIQQITVTL